MFLNFRDINFCSILALQFQRLIPLLFNFPSTAKSLQTVQVWQLCRNEDECNPQKSLLCGYFFNVFLLESVVIDSWIPHFHWFFCICILRDSIDFTFYRLLIFQATLISPISTALRDKWLELLATCTISRSDGIQIQILFLFQDEIQTRIFNIDEEQLCYGRPNVIFPKKAKNLNDEWVWVVNIDNYTQSVEVGCMVERQIIRLWKFSFCRLKNAIMPPSLKTLDEIDM